MSNWHRWTLALVLAFLGGVSQAATSTQAVFGDYVRSGLIALGPAIVALNLTLKPNGGVK